MFDVPEDLKAILDACPGWQVAGSVAELTELAVGDAVDGWHEVAYDVPGRGPVVEARVCRVNNGIAANYLEPYMRRRDPDCMVIGDARPTNKPRYAERFGVGFEQTRAETFDWLKTQPLALLPFISGVPGKGIDAIAVVPANAGFFALGLALLQGILGPDEIRPDFHPRAVVYVAPPFRHTHFDGKQVVVHNRLEHLHELFSYNLYPGPSAKKGIYGVLLALGEREQWVTAHCSTVRIITPYGKRLTVMHEGASGGGKSEMLEEIHRERDGRLLLGRRLADGDERHLILPRGCQLQPVTDDMALCHPSLQDGDGRLKLIDAESAWFVRVNHIDRYGVDPHLEEQTINAREPLLFLNIRAVPGATALIWEHIEDEPGKPCPNPRVVIPRQTIPGVVNGPVRVDVRSFGVRTPPCSRQAPSYGIIGLFHVLPPALSWLWRLVAPRGHANPSIVQTEGMSSEGVGSYWPFATGRRVDQANLLLTQFREGRRMRHVLIPNQHIGGWKVGFMGQWIARDYLARRGPDPFDPDQITPARCPLLGYALNSLVIEGQDIPPIFLQVDRQKEVGEDGYDAGAAILTDFFRKELANYLVPDLDPLGRQIIECMLDGGTVRDYEALIPGLAIVADEDL
ncbi:DUF4914 family protein [Tautonia sociabilis]|uniref:DUF4914 family protein n=2 Tax=Tautonia sociabilis TaxID=2080755 RepID=A0A432MS95_9BACT|nr:DUF4914 family protein [Tautonia sociabilis]